MSVLKFFILIQLLVITNETLQLCFFEIGYVYIFCRY